MKDERILGILDGLRTMPFIDCLHQNPESSDSVVLASQVDSLTAHFPPCMHSLTQQLRRDHHLKYEGRQHLGTFLKSIGMPMDESLAFWRASFAPKIGDDRFAKEYAYNVRHLYGQEGKRVPAPPLSCAKVIASSFSGGNNAVAGCPFKYLKSDALGSMLEVYSNYKLGEADIADLQGKVAGKHYQLACTKLLAMMNDMQSSGDTITHPHIYFQRALKHHQKDIEDL